ncbi:hypothetical protein KUTeg_014881 [Tegillarca granosa]|uniref:Uncharacterized protein n=1 Tax=Tegillarca granosa TaxID=220873 RepID=A0ABQ9ES68_TEGGR|nr:hypothetical protein KUTeg_014881 [Tegillarca granosa]
MNTTKPDVRHLFNCWHVAKSSEDDGDLENEKWISMFYHVTDTHEGYQGKIQ